VTMASVVSRSRLKALPGTSSPYIYHPSHHRDNVTAPHGRPNLRSRLHFRHSQEGDHESSYEHVVALEKKNLINRQIHEDLGGPLSPDHIIEFRLKFSWCGKPLFSAS
jgi:hypothetical protein